jgi:hypothetical protein
MPDVRLLTIAPRPTLVVAAATSWEAFPELWPRLLDDVYAAIGPVRTGRRNVMLYRDDAPHVEVGVLGRGPPSPERAVVESTLPGGRVATAVHRGDYAELGATHRAVLAWCSDRGHEPAGPRWEVYGHWREQPAELETEVYHLLR